MEKKYKILILSNPQNAQLMEDEYIANAFREDGHIVDLKWVDYDEELDQYYDIIIRRNTWVKDEADIPYFKTKNDEMKERLLSKDIKTVNLIGLDGKGKGYLCELYKEGKQVVPTVDNLNDVLKFGEVERYVLKDNDSFGSALNQKFVTSEELEHDFEEKYLIQPELKFQSEIQCYFIGNKLMYAHEYIPSKHPNYPEPKLIELTEDQNKLAHQFAKRSGLKHGVQRIDFLKLMDNSLLLLEIEDNSPNMNIKKLDIELKSKVLREYKKNIYEFLEQS